MSGSTSSFHVANGQIIGPDKKIFIAKGVNVLWDQLNAAVGNGTTMPLTTAFPGLNMIRVNYEDAGWQSPAAILAAINTLTAKGIVVELEDHTGISATPYTGSQLAAEQAWFSTLATTFKNNPYVWFGTFNEPGNGTNLAGIAAQEVATYNTIRATGNNNPILMEEPSGGNPGLVGANATGYDGAGPMPPADYANMHNIIWDLHYYGWSSKYSTNQATVSAALTGSASSASGIAGAQTITSADGKVPVIIGEFGNSTSGLSIDANATQVLQAVASSGSGFLAYAWGYPFVPGNQLVDSNLKITAYGKQISALIGLTPPPLPNSTPTPTPTPTPASNEITPTSGGTLTDSAGNTWTLTAGGVIDENGTPIPGGSGTAAVAIVNNVIYGQDATSKAWYTYSPTTHTWTSATAPILIPTPTPTPTPNEITTTSGGTLSDSAGNAWTLTAGGVIDENGTPIPGGSGTAAVAIVNNVIYGQDATSKAWYTYSPTTHTWTSATAPILIPTPTPTASSNNTTVELGTTSSAPTQASATVGGDNVPITATAGDHMLFISGTADTVNLSGGTYTITDTGAGNTYVLPAAGNGYDSFTTNVLMAKDTMDLRPALAATDWNGAAATLSDYLSVDTTPQGTVLSIAATSGGTPTAIATIAGTSATTLSSMLIHALT